MFEHSTHINASPERVWDIWADVERWPTWTASVTSIERLDDGPLGVGSRVRIRQPKLPTVVWTVDEFTPHLRYAWVASSPGVRTRGIHQIDPAPGGGVTVTAGIDQQGLMAPVLNLLAGRITHRYMAMELDGLKASAESDPA